MLSNVRSRMKIGQMSYNFYDSARRVIAPTRGRESMSLLGRADSP
jgi:hypothetical protein